MQTSEQTETTVHHLVEVCRDGQNGFESAAKAVKDPLLQAELMQYSVQRMGFATDLDAALGAMGESAHEGGTVSGVLHRGWMNLRAAIVSDDRYLVLAECERGEDSALEAYRDAIQNGLSPSVEPLIETQYEQVQRVHDRIKELRDAARSQRTN